MTRILSGDDLSGIVPRAAPRDLSGVDFEREWLEPLPGLAGRPGWRADVQWLMREVLPVAMSRTRNRLIGRSPGDGFRAKRPELLPMTALEGARALP